MANRVFKGALRFNHPEFKYMSFVFDESNNSCTVHANVKIPTMGDVVLKGIITEWITEDTPQSKESVKTTAKKTAKENK